jgi:glucan 1,3-beta-glucosidase
MRVSLRIFGFAATATSVLSQKSPDNSFPASGSTYWYANVKHIGINAPFTSNWTLFRNVLDYGAKGDGSTDDTAAIRKAITVGNDEAERGTGHWGSTGQPAVVFFPPGTYLVNDTIKNYIGTVLMGDPTNRPIIKASTAFKAPTLLHGPDPIYSGLVGFYHEVKNLVFDTTALPVTSNVTLVDWSVSQACQLSNSAFRMRKDAIGHTAIAVRGTTSPLLLNDLEISGGGVGYTGASTQYHFKSITFRGTKTAIRPTNTVHLMVQGCEFEDVSVGVDMSGGTLGQLTMIDSIAKHTSTLVNTDANQRASLGSIVLENIVVDATVGAVSRRYSTFTSTTDTDQKCRPFAQEILQFCQALLLWVTPGFAAMSTQAIQPPGAPSCPLIGSFPPRDRPFWSMKPAHISQSNRRPMQISQLIK